MKHYYVFVRALGRMIMPKTPDDDLYCRECQSVNVREVSRKKYPIGEIEEMEKIEVFVLQID